jgi:O-antigen/teichoic acid export membrane protein
MLNASQLTLKQRVFNAGLWSLGSFVLSMVLRFGSSMLMTRLLKPEMFGVMSIATTVMVGLAMFSDVGLRQNVVQSPRGNEPSYLNTAWTVQIIRGSLLLSIGLCVSGVIYWANKWGGYIPADSVYASPSLPGVIAVLSISAVIAGFESTKLYQASRGLSLGSITRIEIIAQVSGLVCMISWTLYDRSIWALVAGSLCGSFVKAALSHSLLNGVRNRWAWERDAVHEFIHFGKWIFMASIFGFLVNSGDRLLLGGLINSTTLGVYTIASLIATSVEGILSRIMTDVSFPAFSEVVRERRAELKQIYYRFLVVIASVAYFTSGSLMTFGQSLIDLLYDPRYQQAGWMLEILSAVLLTIPFRLATQSFLALGKPSLQTNIVLARLVVLFAGTPIVSHYFGLPGAVLTIVLSHFVSLPIIIFYNVRHQLFDLRKEIYMVGFIFAGLGCGKLASLGLHLILR